MNYSITKEPSSDFIDNTDDTQRTLQLPLLQDVENDIINYVTHFKNNDHHHFISMIADVPICVTIRTENETTHLLIRSGFETVYRSITLPKQSLLRRLFFRKGPTANEVLSLLNHPWKKLSFRRLSGSALEKQLLRMDDQLIILHHNIGILFSHAAQSDFNDILRNERGQASVLFWRFIKMLAGSIDLIESLSVSTKWQQLEFEFHISPLIPLRVAKTNITKDYDILERKRLIGNDIVLIIFQQEGFSPINWCSIQSKQVHVIICISPSQINQLLEVRIFKRASIIPCVPQYIKCLNINDPDHRDELLATILMAERTAYNSPEFQHLFVRTRTQLLKELIQPFL